MPRARKRQQPRKFDAEFRESAVRIVRETGKSVAQVAPELVPAGLMRLSVGIEGCDNLRDDLRTSLT